MDDKEKVILNKSNLSTVSFALGIPMGAAMESLSGITSVYLKHLQRNTAKRSEKELASHLDRLGISSFGEVDKNAYKIGMTCPPQNLDKALELFQEILLEPEFNEGTVKKIVQQQMGMLQQIMQMPQAQLFTFTRWKAAFGDSVISKSDMGSVEDLQKISVDDLEKLHKQILNLHPKFGAIGVGIDESKFVSIDNLMNQYGTQVPDIELYDKKVPRLNTVVDKMPETSKNAYLSINMQSQGNNVSKLEDTIFNSVLSGGFSGRMFTEIRDKRNLSYGPFSANTKFAKLGLITAGMDVLPSRSPEALKVTLELMRGVLTEKIPEDEMRRALKSAQRISVFVTDSATNYTKWLLNKMNSNTEWDMEKEKTMLEAAAQSNWQEIMLKHWKVENMTLGIAGDPGQAIEHWESSVLEVVEQ